MTSKDYDDLLESFMNNSAKVYNEDKNSLSAQEETVPAAYNIDGPASKSRDIKSAERGRVIEKKNKKARKRKEHNGSSAGFKVFRVLAGFAMVCAVVAVVCASVMLIYAFSVINGEAVFDLTERKYALNQTSYIYAYNEDGSLKELTRLHGEENRIWINLEDMGEFLPNAIIAIEDQRFKEHHGVDWIRTIGVIVKPSNLGQGGSTITQQLIKNLTDEKQVTFSRKFNEILSALNLEKHNNKDDILEAYLNTIFLSSGCYGVRTAAEKYFGKDVDKLNLAECACLASITQSPSKYNPLINPDKNRERQLVVLSNMLEQKLITQEQYDEAVAYKMVFTNSPDYKGSQVTGSDEAANTNVIDSWYIDYVIKTVISDLQKQGYTYRRARNMIYGGGLKIYSAMDQNVQASLEDVYENYRKMPNKKVQGAMVVMDYKGRVLGLIGGTGKKKTALGFNRATEAERPPGSTIKPIGVYGPALEKSLQEDDFNFYWSTIELDAPSSIKVDGKPWPTNEGGGYSSERIPIQKGLADSKNTIAIRTLIKIGVDYSFDYLTKKFHISTLDDVKDRDWSPVGLGGTTTGTIPLEMTAAYAAFGNGGQYYYPYCYYKVTDSRGNVILESKPEETKEQALSEGTAWVMNKLLQTVMTSGTGRFYKIKGVQCIGKTGTTSGSFDRWFIGGTPEYIAAVWYGFDTNKEIVYNLSPNPAGTLWNAVFTRIYDKNGKNKTEFPEYDGIVRKAYDPRNGLLARYSSGRYGWYDVNNLPAYSGNSGTTKAPETTAPAENTGGNAQAAANSGSATQSGGTNTGTQ